MATAEVPRTSNYFDKDKTSDSEKTKEKVQAYESGFNRGFGKFGRINNVESYLETFSKKVQKLEEELEKAKDKILALEQKVSNLEGSVTKNNASKASSEIKENTNE